MIDLKFQEFSKLNPMEICLLIMRLVENNKVDKAKSLYQTVINKILWFTFLQLKGKDSFKVYPKQIDKKIFDVIISFKSLSSAVKLESMI